MDFQHKPRLVKAIGRQVFRRGCAYIAAQAQVAQAALQRRHALAICRIAHGLRQHPPVLGIAADAALQRPLRQGISPAIAEGNAVKPRLVQGRLGHGMERAPVEHKRFHGAKVQRQ